MIMKNMNIQVLIAGLSMTVVGCSGFLQKNGGLVSRDGQVQVSQANIDPDTGLPITGATTMATLNEVIDRAENSIIGTSGARIVSRNAGNFQTAINLSRDNFFENRDAAQVSSSGVMAALQVVHGACASLTAGAAGTLNTQFGINTTLSVATNRAALVNFGVRLISNTTLIMAAIDPNLINQVTAIVDAQVSELQSATVPTGTNAVQAAAVSVCTAAVLAGAFGIGS